jgi:hypothetical protein
MGSAMPLTAAQRMAFQRLPVAKYIGTPIAMPSAAMPEPWSTEKHVELFQRLLMKCSVAKERKGRKATRSGQRPFTGKTCQHMRMVDDSKA